ncbi:MAG: response regulator [Candidatus Thermoplasmatota archaeon]
MTKTILIVDDEEDIRTSVGQLFEVSGYQVITAHNGLECLEKLERTIPDLIILDIMMPGMNGWDVAARIKENQRWKQIPIVFLTAKGDEMSIGMGHLAAVEYITKPFDIMHLKASIDRILHA